MTTRCPDFKNKRGLWSKSLRLEGQQFVTKGASHWYNMRARCSPSRARYEAFPTYHGCTLSSDFNDFQMFCDWLQTQKGYGTVGWVLDKDILVKGNKHYSKETCCFVPNGVNVLFTNRVNDRGLLPLGVSEYTHKNQVKYRAICNKNGTSVHLGLHASPEEAFEVYKTYKEALIKEVAEELKDSVDIKVYEAMMNYVVEITD